MARSWLPAYRRHDPHDLIAMLDAWLANDLPAPLSGIRARTTVLAGSHDLYFPPDDCAAEADQIPGARFAVIDSVLGHRAGNPRDAPAEQAFIRSALERLCDD